MNINITLVSQMIAFAMFVYFCMRYVWPPSSRRWMSARPRLPKG
jgi:F-type H+-transporting ATPase subunit b